jgi:hypothetical protein
LVLAGKLNPMLQSWKHYFVKSFFLKFFFEIKIYIKKSIFLQALKNCLI